MYPYKLFLLIVHAVGGAGAEALQKSVNQSAFASDYFSIYLFELPFIAYNRTAQTIGITYPIYDDIPGFETSRL